MQDKLQDDRHTPRNRRTDLNSRSRPMVAATMLLAGAVLVGILFVASSCGGKEATGASSTTSTTKRHTVSSQKALTEAPAKTDLRMIQNVSFVSISLVDASGPEKSYGVSAAREPAQKLIEAVRSAKKVEGKSTSTVTGQQSEHSSLIFVLSTRQTLTFTMDLASGLISRSGETWRPEGDLKELIAAAIKKPR